MEIPFMIDETQINLIIPHPSSFMRRPIIKYRLLLLLFTYDFLSQFPGNSKYKIMALIHNYTMKLLLPCYNRRFITELR